MNTRNSSTIVPRDRPPTLEDQASEAFVQRLNGPWSGLDQTQLEQRLQSDPDYADAYRRIQESWDDLDTQAESPELMRHRAEALNFARRTHGRRWLNAGAGKKVRWRFAASIVLGLLAFVGIWQASPYGYRPGQYTTDIGEQRIVDLKDHSRIALDAATRLRVRYTDDTRLIELQQGQAQFSVAKDPTRPFKVIAGDQIIVALGTVFTVEYQGKDVHVAMMEGRVAIVPQRTTASSASTPTTRIASAASDTHSEKLSDANSNKASDPLELSAGQEVRINSAGQTTLIPQADLEAATAWREGKVIIRMEPLSEAARKLNRYSRLQIQIDDPQLAARHIGGVFEAGDTQGFVSAVQRLYAISADYSDSDKVRLSVAH